MEIKLLRSALQRLDEQPLRLVEINDHSTPMSEVLNSPAVQKAINSVPGFVDEILSTAQEAIKRLPGTKAKPAAPDVVVQGQGPSTN